MKFVTAFIFYIFKKRTKNLLTSIPVSIILFIDNRFFVSPRKELQKSNISLFCNYNIIFSLFNQFGLVIEYNKSEILYFSRLIRNYNSSPLDLRPLKGSLFKPKNTWKYLKLFFEKKLSFYQHIYYYTNKALCMIKDMKMLGNLIRGISPTHKQLLYKIYVFLITLYKF